MSCKSKEGWTYAHTHFGSSAGLGRLLCTLLSARVGSPPLQLLPLVQYSLLIRCKIVTDTC